MGRDWAGMAVAAVAIALGVGWCGAILLAVSPIGEPLGEPSVQLLTAIGGGLLAIVATYVGGRGRPPE